MKYLALRNAQTQRTERVRGRIETKTDGENLWAFQKVFTKRSCEAASRKTASHVTTFCELLSTRRLTASITMLYIWAIYFVVELCASSVSHDHV